MNGSCRPGRAWKAVRADERFSAEAKDMGIQYGTGHYWPRGEKEEGLALTLQQTTRARGALPIVLACVCEEGPGVGRTDGGTRFCMRLTDWFYERALERWSRERMPDLTILSGELSREREEAFFSAAGILCAGQHFLLFRRGRARVFLLNRRFLRPHLKEIDLPREGSGRWALEEGELQQGLGILLETDGFSRGVTGEERLACLAVDERSWGQRLESRLSELGRMGESRGAGGAAVFVVTR